jgi:DNA mismatch endonuclease (patch repair protein)
MSLFFPSDRDPAAGFRTKLHRDLLAIVTQKSRTVNRRPCDSPCHVENHQEMRAHENDRMQGVPLPDQPVEEPISRDRSRLMANVRRADTKPEIAVRRVAHALGYRFRLHRRDLPGTPDLVFPRLRKIVFVHGCFWHRHAGCKRASSPKTRTAFWEEKFSRNVDRDRKNIADLEARGWSCEIVWECQTVDADRLRRLLIGMLSH